MAIANFKPEVWSPRILRSFDESFVFGSLVNRNYEGEIRNFGDTVRINEVGPISVSDYTSTGIGTPAELTDAQKVLTIDQAKTWSFRVEDIDAAQARPGVMEEAMRKGGVAIANTIDKHLVSLHSDAGQTVGSTGAANVLTPYTTSVAAGIYHIASRILYAGRLLDEANVPAMGRWMVLDPKFHQALVEANVLTGGGMDNPNAPSLQTGRVGSGLGFNFYMTNNVSASTHSKLMFGTNDAITHASQIAKIEAYRPEQHFADAVKGLYLYGSKVVQPAALGVLYAATT